MLIHTQSFWRALISYLANEVYRDVPDEVRPQVCERMQDIAKRLEYTTAPRKFEAAESIAQALTDNPSEGLFRHCVTEPAGLRTFTFDGEILAVPEQFTKLLKDAKHVTLKIDSPGGSAPAALRMIRALKQSRVFVKVEIGKMAVSAAADLAMSGHRRTIRKDGVIVLHEPSHLILGDAAAFRKAASQLDRLQDIFTDLYAAATGRPPSIVREWFKPGVHCTFNAEQALAAGLVHDISL